MENNPNAKPKKFSQSTLYAYLVISLGAALNAFAFSWCFVPNNLPYAGVTGVVLIFDYVLGGIQVGTWNIIANIPIFIAGWKLLGKTMLVRSLYAMLFSSVMIDVIDHFFEFQPMDHILASIYGGVLLGASLAFVLMQGASTGGTDLIARILRLKFGWIPVGKLMLVMDLTVITSSAIIMENMHSAMYAMVALYIIALVMDSITFGVDKSQVAYIISNRQAEVTQALTEKLMRGVTVIPSVGGWSGEPRPMIMCAFRHRQVVALKNLVQEVDPDAFFICCPAYEVLGQGFRRK